MFDRVDDEVPDLAVRVTYDVEQYGRRSYGVKELAFLRVMADHAGFWPAQRVMTSEEKNAFKRLRAKGVISMCSPGEAWGFDPSVYGRPYLAYWIEWELEELHGFTFAEPEWPPDDAPWLRRNKVAL